MKQYIHKGEIMSKFFDFGEKVEGYEIKILNERELRAGAGILFLVALLSFVNCIVMKNILILQIFIWFFLLEFTIRVLINPKYAPSLLLGRFIVNNQTPEYVGAKQKRFAWSIGLFLAIFIFTLTTVFPSTTPIGEESLHNALIGLSCISCLILLYFEAVFGICLGCKLYNLLNKEEAQYCAGATCQKHERAACQKFSTSQSIAICIYFIIAIEVAVYLI